ncbi:MAG TPA: amino acid permease [Nitrososphaerales archaeon]|nr:amino acid permease [Nitrososphaerales archaeon]
MGTAQKIFSRSSSGLVREISPHQAFIYNFMAIGFYGFTWATLFSVSYSQAFLGANVGLAIVLMAVSAIPFYLSTSMLSSAMPRSGGDYVWQSRVLHPSIGFAATFSAWTVWQWYFASFLGTVISTLGLQPLFALLGQTNPGYANLATQLAAGFEQANNTLVFEVTTLVIILGFAVAALGMRFYVRLQYVLFAGSAISALTLLGVLATTGHTQFVTSFNNFAAPLVAAGNQSQVSSSAVTAAGGYYQYIINTAKLATPSFSLGNTLLLFGIIWISFGYAFWSVYNLAEQKKAGSLKSQAWIQVGSSIVFAFFLLALWYLIENVIGLQFLQSFFTLYGNFDPSTNPIAFFFTPYYPALIASISTSTVVWTLILVGLTFGLFQVILIVYFASTRIMLAASIDRVLPEKIAYVHPRTHSPLVALIISAIGCEAFLYLIIYDTSFTSYFSTAGLATQIAYILISVTAIVFPFRKKLIFEASPAGKYKVGGFPLLSILGILALIVNLYIAGIFIFGPPLGFLSVSTSSSIEFVAGIFIACFIVYLIAYGARKSQHIDLAYSFREVPPE